jgi:hypothetical protein
MGPMAGRRISPAVMICSPLNNIPRHYTFACYHYLCSGLDLSYMTRIWFARSLFRGGEAVGAKANGLIVGRSCIG